MDQLSLLQFEFFLEKSLNNFHWFQVIHTAAQIASSQVSQQNQKYYILLMITDGVINGIIPLQF